MNLQETLQADLKQAMRDGNEIKRSTIRMALSDIKNAEIAKGATLDESGVHEVFRRMVKQRKESIEAFTKGKRPDLVAREQAELEIIMAYLPKEMSRDEVVAVARQVIKDVGARGPADKGKVMGKLMSQVKGKADGKLVNDVVTELLAGASTS